MRSGSNRLNISRAAGSEGKLESAGSDLSIAGRARFLLDEVLKRGKADLPALIAKPVEANALPDLNMRITNEARMQKNELRVITLCFRRLSNVDCSLK